MTNRYLITVCQEIIVPVEVEAETAQEAEEIALASRGIAGQSYYGETRIARTCQLEE